MEHSSILVNKFSLSFILSPQISDPQGRTENGLPVPKIGSVQLFFSFFGSVKEHFADVPTAKGILQKYPQPTKILQKTSSRWIYQFINGLYASVNHQPFPLLRKPQIPNQRFSFHGLWLKLSVICASLLHCPGAISLCSAPVRASSPLQLWRFQTSASPVLLFPSSDDGF